MTGEDRESGDHHDCSARDSARSLVEAIRHGFYARRKARTARTRRWSSPVAKYLGSVAHANVQDIDFDPFRATYLPVAGGAPQGPPTGQSFWAASASGVGTQTVTWKVRDGDWSVVLMNADGSRGVVADVDLGAKLSFLLWVAIGSLIGGLLVVGGSSALIVLAARTPQQSPVPPTPPAADSGSGTTLGPEPVDRSAEAPPRG